MEEFFLSKSDVIRTGFVIVVIVSAVLTVFCAFHCLYLLDFGKDKTAERAKQASLRFLGIFIASALCLAFLP